MFGSKCQNRPATIVLTATAPGFVRIVFQSKHPAQVRLFIYSGVKTAIDLEIVAKVGSQAGVETYIISDQVGSTRLQRFASVAQDASLVLATMVLSMGKTFVTDRCILTGEAAEFQSETLAVLNGSDRIETIQEVRHEAPRTISELRNSIVTSDDARADFNVTGAIAKGNAKAICHQGNRGVLLGEKAVIAVSPKLLIDEFDVEAGHGCAIGRLNAEEMYYLTSRGLDNATAQRLIVSGYTAPFLQKLTDPEWRRYVDAKLNKKLKGVES